MSTRIGPSSAAAAVVTSRSVGTDSTGVATVSVSEDDDLSSDGMESVDAVDSSSRSEFDSSVRVNVRLSPVDASVTRAATVRSVATLTTDVSDTSGDDSVESVHMMEEVDETSAADDVVYVGPDVLGSSSGTLGVDSSTRFLRPMSSRDRESALVSGVATRTRSNAVGPSTVHKPLGPFALDHTLCLVYVNLKLHLPADDPDLNNLKRRLREVSPNHNELIRMKRNNRGRILYTIDDELVVSLCSIWVNRVWSTVPEFWTMLSPLGSRVRLLGIQFIVPEVSEDCPQVRPQIPHADVEQKSVVISVAMSLSGDPLKTLISVNRSINSCSNDLVHVTEEFRCADTSLFLYDTGVVHAGPGSSRYSGPFPKFLVDRVFIVFCSADIDEARLDKYYEHNGLNVDLKTVLFQPTRPDPPEPPTSR